MAFEEIECLRPVTGLAAIPPAGVRVKARSLSRGGKEPARWIELAIGKALAAALKFPPGTDKVGVRLLFGTGEDAGKVGITVDMSAGRFVATRKKDGGFTLGINGQSADGLFALEFPLFAVLDVPVIAPPGKAPIAVFEASYAMLAAD